MTRRGLVESVPTLASADPGRSLSTADCAVYAHHPGLNSPSNTFGSLLIDADLDAAMAAALRFDPFDPTAPYRSVDRMASVDFRAHAS